MAKNKEQDPIVIKKIKKSKHDHHGGAWKVAYADFVTAMMAFFLLMWLLNSTSEEQRRGISNYFGPVGLATGQAGSGGLLGGVSVSSEEAILNSSAAPAISLITPQNLSEDHQTDVDDRIEPSEHQESKVLSSTVSEELDIQKVAENYEEQQLRELEQELKVTLEEFAKKEGLLDNIIIEMTPEGLRIQLVDQQKKSMFPLGSDNMYPHTEKILSRVAEIIRSVPNKIAISGHTDAKPYSNSLTFGNWELSTQRANAARRVIKKSGIPDGRMSEVVGKASTDLFNKDDPDSPQNRRISILLLKAGTENNSFETQIKDNEKLFQEADKNVPKPRNIGKGPETVGQHSSQPQQLDISFMNKPKPVTGP